MYVTSIGKNNPIAPVTAPVQPAPVHASNQQKGSTLYIAPAKPDADLPLTPTATYSKAEASGSSKPSAQDMILQRMAERIITKQYSEGNQFYKLLYGHIALRIDPNLRSASVGPSREELLSRAKEMVGQDGPFSAETISKQIVGFVTQHSQGDPAKTERFRAAVQDAFVKLSTMTGGQMPELTQHTYDAVMEGLDASVSTAASTGTTDAFSGSAASGL